MKRLRSILKRPKKTPQPWPPGEHPPLPSGLPGGAVPLVLGAACTLCLAGDGSSVVWKEEMSRLHRAAAEGSRVEVRRFLRRPEHDVDQLNERGMRGGNPGDPARQEKA